MDNSKRIAELEAERLSELEDKRRDLLNFRHNPLYFHVPYDPLKLAARLSAIDSELQKLRNHET